MDFKLDVGDLAEDEVQKAVEDTFSADFVFRSPRRDCGREVTDVLVLFDDVGLVIQSKAQAISLQSSKPNSSLDWARKNLAKTTRQVHGAVRAIREGRVLHVENDRRGLVPFAHQDFSWLYGLIILHHRSHPYDSASLVPATREVKVPVHVLSFRDFWNLSKLLDTPSDLINYLESRSDVLISTLNPKVHKEQEVFTYYLRHLEDIMAVRAKARGDVFSAQDARPYANELRRIVKGTHPDLKCGLAIDHMIDKIHDLDPSLGVLHIAGEATPRDDRAAYARIATELAKIPRGRRIALGRHYLEKARQAANSSEDRFVVTHSTRRSECMVLLASPLPRNKRKKRNEKLLHLISLAKAYYQVHRAIGVATEAAGQMGSSYDMVFLESVPIPDQRAEELGKQIFGQTDRRLLGEF